jgi:hypothetical protein
LNTIDASSQLSGQLGSVMTEFPKWDVRLQATKRITALYASDMTVQPETQLAKNRYCMHMKQAYRFYFPAFLHLPPAFVFNSGFGVKVSLGALSLSRQETRRVVSAKQ